MKSFSRSTVNWNNNSYTVSILLDIKLVEYAILTMYAACRSSSGIRSRHFNPNIAHFLLLPPISMILFAASEEYAFFSRGRMDGVLHVIYFSYPPLSSYIIALIEALIEAFIQDRFSCESPWLLQKNTMCPLALRATPVVPQVSRASTRRLYYGNWTIVFYHPSHYSIYSHF